MRKGFSNDTEVGTYILAEICLEDSRAEKGVT